MMGRINDMISVKNLSYSYNRDGNFAVKNVSFEVENGETFGFLGPSGAQVFKHGFIGHQYSHGRAG